MEFTTKAGETRSKNAHKAYYELIKLIFKGIDTYLNSSVSRFDYFTHFYENGTFENLIE